MLPQQIFWWSKILYITRREQLIREQPSIYMGRGMFLWKKTKLRMTLLMCTPLLCGFSLPYFRNDGTILILKIQHPLQECMILQSSKIVVRVHIL